MKSSIRASYIASIGAITIPFLESIRSFRIILKGYYKKGFIALNI